MCVGDTRARASHARAERARRARRGATPRVARRASCDVARKTLATGRVTCRASAFGTAAWGDETRGFGTRYRERDLAAALTRALERGVTFVDTAEAYGAGARAFEQGAEEMVSAREDDGEARRRARRRVRRNEGVHGAVDERERGRGGAIDDEELGGRARGVGAEERGGGVRFGVDSFSVSDVDAERAVRRARGGDGQRAVSGGGGE